MMQGKEEKKRRKKIEEQNLEIAVAADWRAFSSFLTSEFESVQEG